LVERIAMSPTIGSTSNAIGGAGQVHAIASVQASASPASSNPSAGTGSGAMAPGLNSLSDQPLSPQVMNELMKLYASLHGAVA
jgi:hypothetical protein